MLATLLVIPGVNSPRGGKFVIQLLRIPWPGVRGAWHWWVHKVNYIICETVLVVLEEAIAVKWQISNCEVYQAYWCQVISTKCTNKKNLTFNSQEILLWYGKSLLYCYNRTSLSNQLVIVMLTTIANEVVKVIKAIQSEHLQLLVKLHNLLIVFSTIVQCWHDQVYDGQYTTH